MNNYQKTILKRAAKILENSLRDYEITISGSHDVKMYCQTKIGTGENEQFMVLFLDTQNRLIQSEIMFTGTINAASVYPREVVKRALELNATNVILSHNHPSGVVTPSQADKLITDRLKQALALLDISVLDHVIVSGSESYAFSEAGLL